MLQLTCVIEEIGNSKRLNDKLRHAQKVKNILKISKNKEMEKHELTNNMFNIFYMFID